MTILSSDPYKSKIFFSSVIQSISKIMVWWWKTKDLNGFGIIKKKLGFMDGETRIWM